MKCLNENPVNVSYLTIWHLESFYKLNPFSHCGSITFFIKELAIWDRGRMQRRGYAHGYMHWPKLIEILLLSMLGQLKEVTPILNDISHM